MTALPVEFGHFQPAEQPLPAEHTERSGQQTQRPRVQQAPRDRAGPEAGHSAPDTAAEIPTDLLSAYLAGSVTNCFDTDSRLSSEITDGPVSAGLPPPST